MGFLVPGRQRGFLIAELVVVAAIIALISAVVMANISESKRESRDVQRRSDLDNLQVALRLYKDAYGAYPGATSTNPVYDDGIIVGGGTAFDSLISPYLGGTIKDPMNNTVYRYYYDSDYNCGGSKKVLIALTMERGNAGNHDTVCGTTYAQLGPSGPTPTASSYVVILR